jgi:hypothetical protein
MIYYPSSGYEAQKPKQRTKKQILADKCLTLWSKIIHKKFNETCQMCGKSSGTMNAHHILTKGSNPQHKYRVENGILLCVHCHKYADNSPHVSPEKFTNWFETKYPQWYNDICLMKFSKPKSQNIEDTWKYLKQNESELSK